MNRKIFYNNIVYSFSIKFNVFLSFLEFNSYSFKPVCVPDDFVISSI